VVRHVPVLLVAFLAIGALSCGTSRYSSSGFRLPPDGNVERGKAAFLAWMPHLSCRLQFGPSASDHSTSRPRNIGRVGNPSSVGRLSGDVDHLPVVPTRALSGQPDRGRTAVAHAGLRGSHHRAATHGYRRVSTGALQGGADHADVPVLLEVTLCGASLSLWLTSPWRCSSR
jgi:hypothetical protein